MEPEWAKFKVGEISTGRNWTNPDCVPFDTVSHVAHLHVAQRIMQDQSINAALVSDESKLNTKRILVSWLSPNDWGGAGGFRYGNVRYTYNFQALIAGKNYYWVEDIAYGIPACRILVTSQDRSNLLTPYDPTRGDGPWWHNTERKTHYRNGLKCLEFMFEEDLDVADAVSLDYVTHSPDKCCISARDCPDLGQSRGKGARRFLAFLLSSHCSLPRHLFTDKQKTSRFFNDDNLDNFASVRRAIVDEVPKFSGDITPESPAAAPLVKAICREYADYQRDNCYLLAAVFMSKADLEKAMESFAIDRFRLTKLSYD
jgi:hypothetical protein